MRYKLTLEYDGSSLFGWQSQTAAATVQGLLEKAVSHLTQQPTNVYGAGRTDAGVHALGQVAHLDTEKDYPASVVANATNHFLKNTPIRVVAAEVVPDTFHARFSALGKLYRYRVLNRFAPSSLRHHFTWHFGEELDLQVMKQAAQQLLGYHDFSAFRASACQSKSALRTLDQLTISRQDDEIIFEVYARSFLHNQVRIMVGTLVWIGAQRLPITVISQAFTEGNRALTGPTAPPEGLYLIRVDYAE